MKNQLISPELWDTINKVAKKANIRDFDIDLKSGSKKGEEFLGEILFVSLRDKKKNDNKDFFVKKALSDDNARSTFPISEAFTNEIIFYSMVWPAFLEFQARMKIKNGFDKVAKCFYTSLTDKFEVLALENLKSRGFEVFERNKILDDAHIKAIFQQLGRFHALSFAYKHHYPEEYNRITKNSVNVFEKFLDIDGFKRNITLTCQKALQCFDPKTDSNLLKTFQRYVNRGFQMYVEGFKYEGKYSVVIHGDFWGNNMMFQYDDSRNVVNLAFMDFQLWGIGTPVCDLSYCLYSSGDKKAFDKLDEYLQIYHDSLSTFLRQFNCNSKTEYPLKALKEDWKKHAKFGMIGALLVIKMNTQSDTEELYRRYRDLFMHMDKINAL